MSKITYDKLGYCAKCHKEIADFKDGKIIGWKELYTVQLKLNSGSMMYVSTCKDCYDNLNKNDFVALMESVIRGWDKELVSPDFSETQRNEYREKFYGLKILERIK